MDNDDAAGLAGVGSSEEPRTTIGVGAAREGEEEEEEIGASRGAGGGVVMGWGTTTRTSE